MDLTDIFREGGSLYIYSGDRPEKPKDAPPDKLIAVLGHDAEEDGIMTWRVEVSA